MLDKLLHWKQRLFENQVINAPVSYNYQEALQDIQQHCPTPEKLVIKLIDDTESGLISTEAFTFKLENTLKLPVQDLIFVPISYFNYLINEKCPNIFLNKNIHWWIDKPKGDDNTITLNISLPWVRHVFTKENIFVEKIRLDMVLLNYQRVLAKIPEIIKDDSPIIYLWCLSADGAHPDPFIFDLSDIEEFKPIFGNPRLTFFAFQNLLPSVVADMKIFGHPIGLSKHRRSIFVFGSREQLGRNLDLIRTTFVNKLKAQLKDKEVQQILNPPENIRPF